MVYSPLPQCGLADHKILAHTSRNKEMIRTELVDRTMEDEVKNVDIPVTNYDDRLPRQRPPSIQHMQSWRRRTHPGLTTSDRHAYGEATCASLWKIWHVIHTEVEINAQDILLDWGCDNVDL